VNEEPKNQPWAAPPETADELHDWLTEHLSIMVVREPIVDGHSAPFAYLCHAFFEDRSPRDCVVWANRGGGKTFYAAVATLLDMVFKAGIEIRILGGSLEQSKRMHAHLRQMFSIEPFDELVEGRITERRIRLSNGSSVELLAQSQTSVRGTRVQKLRCDEIELFDREVWEAAQLTTRAMGVGGARVRGSIECFSTMHVPYGLMHELIEQSSSSSTPRRIFKWGVVDVLDACDDTHACIGDDGPCPLAPECCGIAKARKHPPRTPREVPGHIGIDDAIALKQRVGDDTWKAEMLCIRPQRSDCVLPEFDDRVHVVDSIPGSARAGIRVAGMDFGIRSPTVVLFAHVDPRGVLWIVDEHVESDAALSEHIGVIKAHRTAPEWIGVDPAGRQRGFQTGISDVQAMRRAGLIVKDRKLGLHEGLKLIRSRLKPARGEVRVYIHQSCVRLIDSVRKYHYPKDQPFTDAPEKDGHDHCVDALRYLIQNLDMGYTSTEERYIPNA
jgi:hypothetical protein